MTNLKKFDVEILRLLQGGYDKGSRIPISVSKLIEAKRQAEEPKLEYALKAYLTLKNPWAWDSERMNTAVAEIIAVIQPFLSPASSETQS